LHEPQNTARDSKHVDGKMPEYFHTISALAENWVHHYQPALLCEE
jgi:hypothetical protein